MNKVELNAPAKINIGLSIVSKRDDGFHNLETLFYQINDLYDELYFEKADKYQLTIDNNSELEQDNIITKAVKLLEEKSSNRINVKIKLKKKIPIGAGLGGGSSDGATTLKAINKLFNIELSRSELTSIALKLGSDVPLFLYNYPTVGKSRGEILTKSELKIEYPILLVNPGIHISTKEAFASITPKENRFNYFEIEKIKITNWQNNIINDFEIGIFSQYPEIKKIKETLLKNNALFASMSGTGSTVFGIFENIKKAKTVVNLFPKSYFTFIGNIK